jgi:hypothetical protein
MSTPLATSLAAGACGLFMLAAPCHVQIAGQQQTTMAPRTLRSGTARGVQILAVAGNQ